MMDNTPDDWESSENGEDIFDSEAFVQSINEQDILGFDLMVDFEYLDNLKKQYGFETWLDIIMNHKLQGEIENFILFSPNLPTALSIYSALIHRLGFTDEHEKLRRIWTKKVLVVARRDYYTARENLRSELHEIYAITILEQFREEVRNLEDYRQKMLETKKNIEAKKKALFETDEIDENYTKYFFREFYDIYTERFADDGTDEAKRNVKRRQDKLISLFSTASIQAPNFHSLVELYEDIMSIFGKELSVEDKAFIKSLTNMTIFKGEELLGKLRNPDHVSDAQEKMRVLRDFSDYLSRLD